MSRNLKNTGSKATADLKAAIAAALEPVWDIKTDQPGEKLKEGMVPALLEALNGMRALKRQRRKPRQLARRVCCGSPKTLRAFAT
jgi:hypothetical protein